MAATSVFVALVAAVALITAAAVLWWFLLLLVAVLTAAFVSAGSVTVAVWAVVTLLLLEAATEMASAATVTVPVVTVVVVVVEVAAAVAETDSALAAALVVTAAVNAELMLMAEVKCAHTGGDVDPSAAPPSYSCCEHRKQLLCPALEYFPLPHVKQAPEVTAPAALTHLLKYLPKAQSYAQRFLGSISIEFHCT
jgi:hypothetical protein